MKYEPYSPDKHGPVSTSKTKPHGSGHWQGMLAAMVSPLVVTVENPQNEGIAIRKAAMSLGRRVTVRKLDATHLYVEEKEPTIQK